MLRKSFTRVLTHCVAGVFCVSAHLVQSAETPLNLVPVLYQTVATEQLVDGQVEAVNQSTLSAQTSGQVLEVYFDADQMVKKGEVLMRFKDAEQQTGVASANAQFNEAKARVSETNKEFLRVKELSSKNALSQSNLDTAVANAQTARARLSAAEAAVRQAQQQLEYTVVKAPFSGIVLQRHIETGEMASPGQSLMTGFSTEKLRIVASVPQNMIEAVRQHKQARVLLQAAQGTRSINSESITVLPYSDAGHSFKVRVELPANTDDLYPGMFAKVAFVTGSEKRLVAPLTAVAFRGEVRAAYVVKDPQVAEAELEFSMRQVRLGKSFDSGMVEILSGLSAGEQIAYDPLRASVLLKEQRAKHSAALQAQAHAAH